MVAGFSVGDSVTWGSLCYHDSRGARRRCWIGLGAYMYGRRGFLVLGLQILALSARFSPKV